MPAPNRLEEIYKIVTPKDLLGGFELSALGANGQQSVVESVLQVLLGHDSGGIFRIDDIIKFLTEMSTLSSSDDQKKVNDVVWIFPMSGPTFPKSDDRYSYGVKPGDTPSSPSKSVRLLEAIKSQEKTDNTSTRLGIIMTKTPNITLNARNTDLISMFLRAIPTLEMSRAMPYLDVRFMLSRAARGGQDGKTVNVPSLIKFLNGAQTVKDGTADGSMLDGMEIKGPGGDKDIATMTDMGIFLAPQTLVNWSPDQTRKSRAAPVIDPSRPFLSIERAEIDVVASPSWSVAFKGMKLYLILHDRSRLAEIADLVRPATYTGTNLRVSYGWVHPEGADPQRSLLNKDASTFGQNAWADLINKMRITEIYGIKNASYSFDQSGQVKIVLQLYMLGTQELYVSKITEDTDYKDTHNRLLEIGELVSRLAEQLGLNNDRWKETRVPQFLDAVERGDRPDLTAKEFPKALSEVRAIIQAAGGSQNSANKQAAQDLLSKFDDVLGSTDGKNKGMVEKLKDYVDGQLKKKIDILVHSPDPFFDLKADSPPPYIKQVQNNILPSKDKSTVTNKVASLAKIMALYVGEPLRALGKFDEVQIVFHPFNEFAGFMRTRSIGELPIEIDYFKKVMNDYAVKKNNPNFTADAFVRLIQDSIVSDPRTAAFGLSQLYQNVNSPEETPKLKNGKSEKDVASTLAEIANKNGGTWKQPAIEMYMETMPRAIYKDPNSANDVDPNATILRLHVYDRQATPYNAFIQLAKVQSQMQEGLDMIGKTADPSQNITTAAKSIVQTASDLKAQNSQLSGITPVTNDDGVLVDVQADFDTVKKFITQTVPTFVMGSNNTGVYNINVQTIQDPALNSVNQLRAGGGGQAKPNGEGIGGLPLRVIPGQIEMSSIGCPLLTLNQQWFIDLGTGTDMDNFYGLTGLSHTLSPGKFESVLRFIWMDAYGTYESVLTQINRLKEVLKAGTNKSGG